MAAFAPRLDSTIDTAALREAYHRYGRVQIRELIDAPSADALARWLTESVAWRQMINSGDTVFELSREDRGSFSVSRQDALQAAVDNAARWGFQFRYEALRVSDDPVKRAAANRPIDNFAEFLCSAEALSLLRDICNDDSIAFADAQATRYTAGDFLTGHDDDVAGKGRVAAYVYGLVPQWRPEWGGLLLFHEGGARVQGFVPSFNTLTLFRVPQPHSVSMVSSFAATPRLSVTGWLRSTGP